MARALVAGATGYLGRFVARELKARGHFVRALVRSPDKLADLRDELDEIVTGEVDAHYQNLAADAQGKGSS